MYCYMESRMVTLVCSNSGYEQMDSYHTPKIIDAGELTKIMVTQYMREKTYNNVIQNAVSITVFPMTYFK